MSPSWNQPSPDVSKSPSQKEQGQGEDDNCEIVVTCCLLLVVGGTQRPFVMLLLGCFFLLFGYHLSPNKPEHRFTRGKLCSETYPLQEALNLHPLLFDLVHIF